MDETGEKFLYEIEQARREFRVEHKEAKSLLHEWRTHEKRLAAELTRSAKLMAALQSVSDALKTEAHEVTTDTQNTLKEMREARKAFSEEAEEARGEIDEAIHRMVRERTRQEMGFESAIAQIGPERRRAHEPVSTASSSSRAHASVATVSSRSRAHSLGDMQIRARMIRAKAQARERCRSESPAPVPLFEARPVPTGVMVGPVPTAEVVPEHWQPVSILRSPRRDGS